MTNFLPIHASDLDGILSEIQRQTAEVTALLEPLSLEVLNWRPSESRWSVGGHVDHLVVLNTPYLRTLGTALQQARAEGRSSDGPYRHPWLSRRFAASMEPPPKRRWKTARTMAPSAEVGADVSERFAACQAELSTLVQQARGVDLGRTRISSPFMKLLRFSVGGAFGILLEHNRRHIWLIREVMSSSGFPG